jgi:hypothetical protein
MQPGCAASEQRSACRQSEDEKNQENHQKYEKEYLGDAGRGCGYASKAKNRGDDGNDEEDQCPF